MVRLQTVCFTAVVLMAGGFFVGRMLVAQDRAERGRRGGGFGMHDNAEITKLDLLTNKDVEKDMKMSDDQSSKLEKFADDMHGQLRAEFQGFSQLSPDVRRAKLSEVQDKLKDRENEIRDKLTEILSSDQRDRLGQIELQVSMRFFPAFVLLRREIADNLELTDDQTQKLKEMLQQVGRGGPFGGPGNPGAQNAGGNSSAGGNARTGNGRNANAGSQTMADDQMTKIKEILTSEQNDKLQKMLGPKFAGDTSQMGRGGNGGRGRRNRGGNANSPKSSATPSTTTTTTTTTPPKSTDKAADKPAESSSSK